MRADVEAALLVLERMGLSPADLLAVPGGRPAVPTFAEYVPVVAAAVSAGTRRAYGSHWNRIIDHWGDRRLDEPAPAPRLRRPRQADPPARWTAHVPDDARATNAAMIERGIDSASKLAVSGWTARRWRWT